MAGDTKSVESIGAAHKQAQIKQGLRSFHDEYSKSADSPSEKGSEYAQGRVITTQSKENHNTFMGTEEPII